MFYVISWWLVLKASSLSPVYTCETWDLCLQDRQLFFITCYSKRYVDRFKNKRTSIIHHHHYHHHHQLGWWWCSRWDTCLCCGGSRFNSHCDKSWVRHLIPSCFFLWIKVADLTRFLHMLKRGCCKSNALVFLPFQNQKHKSGKNIRNTLYYLYT